MRKSIFFILTALACLPGFAQQAPVNGSPLMSGGPDGLSPWSSGLVYTHRPVGYAFISKKEMPDIFLMSPNGMAVDTGLWHCLPDGKTPDGAPVYRRAGRIENPWDGSDKFPSRIRIFQDGKEVWLLALANPRELSVARWNGHAFEPYCQSAVSGAARIQDIDFIRRDKRTLEMVLLCNDGAEYRPKEDPKAKKLSYYDGAGVYRGSLPKGKLSRLEFDNDWKQIGEVMAITGWMVQGPSRVACIRTYDGKLDGYVVGSNLGALKFVPYQKKIPAGGLTARPLLKEDGTVRDHGAYSNQFVSYPDVRGARTDLLIGGECAPRIYPLLSKDSPVYGDYKYVWRRESPMYGGSLTVPNVVDWDGDGVLDIVAGNSEGRLLFFKNNGSNMEPDFAPSVEMASDGDPIRFLPGYNIVQGPFEGGWGYLCPTVFDWNGDGLVDVIVSGSRAKYELLLNEGTRTEPKLGKPQTIRYDGMELHGTWRVRPAITLIDGVPHILIMDDKNALHLYRRLDNTHVEDAGLLLLADGGQITGHNNAGEGMGQMGRGKLRFYDWDGDGDMDLFVGSVKRSSYPSPEDGLPYRRFKNKQIDMQVLYFENIGNWRYSAPKQLQIDGKSFYIGAHSNAPEPCMLGDTSHGPNLLVGCESGKYFFFEHSHINYVE